MLTTKQAREIIRKHVNINIWNTMWTNKTRKNPGQLRSVKVYFDGDMLSPLCRELIKAGAKTDELNFTSGSEHLGYPGLTIKCILA